ncbi:sulfotransferase family protein [Paraglaciecola sp. 20A4]|uniref:sulfotransferase family protein n=1 Tax=Paraglaciecola sp. 20A4 TaxID=2687288 RepID=UPI00140E35D3|nr:sulfotransferase family protein [Paraglaciecola sp. 20A4]
METTTIHFANELAEQLEPFAQSLAQRKMQKIKLIIHAGTPKTGTTSLQTYLNKKQRKLRGKGFLYPHNLEQSANPSAPRHQWFEKNLVTAHVENFLANFNNIISQVKDDTHTIILSSEGIYNYWWDFPDESKDVLRALNQLFNVEVWVWFREPLAFIESFYKQCIRNPQVQSNPCYGKDLSFADMLNIPWFSQHLNYQGFVSECQTLFGKNNVLAFQYNGDVVQEVIQKLGLSTPHDNPTPRQNNSLNNASIKLLRTINHYNVKAKDKELLIPYIKEMNGILGHYVNDTLIDDECRKKVLKLSSVMNSNTLFL